MALKENHHNSEAAHGIESREQKYKVVNGINIDPITPTYSWFLKKQETKVQVRPPLT
jgi:hypothetical protein